MLLAHILPAQIPALTERTFHLPGFPLPPTLRLLALRVDVEPGALPAAVGLELHLVADRDIALRVTNPHSFPLVAEIYLLG